MCPDKQFHIVSLIRADGSHRTLAPRGAWTAIGICLVMLATIARLSAVARIGPLHMSGFPALSAVAGRLFLYLLYVVGFKNRMTRLLR